MEYCSRDRHKYRADALDLKQTRPRGKMGWNTIEEKRGMRRARRRGEGDRKEGKMKWWGHSPKYGRKQKIS